MIGLGSKQCPSHGSLPCPSKRVSSPARDLRTWDAYAQAPPSSRVFLVTVKNDNCPSVS